VQLFFCIEALLPAITKEMVAIVLKQGYYITKSDFIETV